VLGTNYLHVLRRPGVAQLLAPALIGRIPDGIAATGIVILVRSLTGSYPAAGLAAGAFGLGTAASAPLAGRALDRLGQRRVLPALAAAFAGILTILVLTGSSLGRGGAIALAALAGLTRPPIEAALRATWPRLVSAGDLDAAYALDSTAQELIWIAGPMLMALLLAVGGPRVPLFACAGTCVAGTAAYAISRHLPARDRSARQAAVSGPLRSARLRTLLVPAACYGVAAGILNLALVAFAAAHGSVAWAGVLVAIWGAGSLAGGVAYGSRNWPGTVEARAMSCLALFGTGLMVLAAAPGLAVLAVLMIPLGLPLSPWLGSLSASVQHAVPAASSAEAFAWTFAAVTVGMSAGNAVAGVIIQNATAQAAFLSAGALALAGASFGALRGRPYLD
jgi:predicted MFS family arabinose efflux permease